MKTTMKRLLSALVVLAMIVPIMSGLSETAFASSVALEYDLSVNGEHTYVATPGQPFLVTLTIHRMDSKEAFSITSLQDEIMYDGGFFEVARTYETSILDHAFTQLLGVPLVKVASRGYRFTSPDTEVFSFYLTPKQTLVEGTTTVVANTTVYASENYGDPMKISTRNLTVYIGETPKPTSTVVYNTAGGTMPPTAFPDVDVQYDDYVYEQPYYAQTVLTGTTITLPGTPSLDEFTFLGWSDGTALHAANESFLVEDNTTFTAVWKPWPQITLNPAGGTVSGKTSFIRKPGAILSLPEPERVNHTFVGWSDGESTMKTSIVVGEEDITLTALWAQHFTLTLDPNQGTVNGSLSQIVPAGFTAAIPTARRSGYQFSGWTDGSGSTIGASYIMPNRDTTLTALWTANPTLLLDANNGEVDGDTAFSDEPQTQITLPTPKRQGYLFDGWYEGSTRRTSPYTLGTTGSVTLTAHWTECNHSKVLFQDNVGEWEYIEGEHRHQRTVVSVGTCPDCGEPVTKSSVESGACSYSGGWNQTSTGHVHECTICHGLADEEAHSYSNGVCTVCGFKNYMIIMPASNPPAAAMPAVAELSIKVSGNTATIDKIADSVLEDLADAGRATDPILIDVSGEGGAIDTIAMPDGIASKVEALKYAGGMTVVLSTGELTLNDEALRAIASAGDGKLVLSIKDSALASAQQTAVKEFDVKSTFSVTATVNGKPVTSFNGGKATVSVAFSPASGTSGNDYVVYYVAADGKTEKMATTYNNGKLTFTTTHFSDYVVAYEKPLVSFVDVATGAYYAAPVKWAVEKGITDGTDATHFSPDAGCTRAQAVTFLYRAAGSPDVSVSNSFRDVPANQYYAKAVAWAVANGITDGVSETEFAPNATCTRAQIVTFLMRYEKAAAASASKFADVSADAYYAGAVGWAVANGITNGTGDNTFSPNATCTRAQIVTFLYRDFVKA